jgi:type IV pilus assembly protein PilB
MLGEVATDLGFLSAPEADAAAAEARAHGRPFGRHLAASGLLGPDELARAVAERFGLDHVDLSVFAVDMGVAGLVPVAAARRYAAVPIAGAHPGALLVAMADPAPVDDLAMLTGHEIVAAIASRPDLDALLGRLEGLDRVVEEAIGSDAREERGTTATVPPEDEAPVVKLVSAIVARAVELGASDVHFFPHAGELRVQYRVDGVLGRDVTVPRRLRSEVVTRVKIMAELDIAERRLPQDGRFDLVVDGRAVDVRVVTLPLVGGESVVLRILDRAGGRRSLEQLGMLPDVLERFFRACVRAHGAVLVTGPTGSGKTTTLYAVLDELNTSERNIVTIEDPVEYRVDGLRQVQVNPRAGVTFANGLRSMMRADPDVVMVGEIRDRETAQIVVESALTGHLVLSTLHTNDAPTAVTRLVEMGVEPFLVASAIDCVVSQRHARRLCEGCKRERTYAPEAVAGWGVNVGEPFTAFEAVGCASCGPTGYRGRIGLFEAMPISEEIRALALAREPAARIAETARTEGMRGLREDGLEHVRRGVTSLAEIARVTC